MLCKLIFSFSEKSVVMASSLVVNQRVFHAKGNNTGRRIEGVGRYKRPLQFLACKCSL